MTFTNSRWLKPIDRFREDLYLYSPKGAQYAADGLRGPRAKAASAGLERGLDRERLGGYISLPEA